MVSALGEEHARASGSSSSVAGRSLGAPDRRQTYRVPRRELWRCDVSIAEDRGEAAGGDDGPGDGDGDDGDGAEDADPEGDPDGESDADGDGDGDGDVDGDRDGEGEGEGVGDEYEDGDAEGEGDADDGDGDGADADGGGENDEDGADGDGADGGDADGADAEDGGAEGDRDGLPDATVQEKLTEPGTPDGYAAVTVTGYAPDAAAAMVPVIRPLPLMARPGGRPDAVNWGDWPSAALSELICNWIAVPGPSDWSPGSTRRTAARRK
jgi:hypothetical protein